MASNAELERAKELLQAALFALNAIPNRRLRHSVFRDTYALAGAIEEFFRRIRRD